MSQDLFFLALGLIVAAGFAAVLGYIVTSSTDRAVRAVASLGLTEVPWWALRRPQGRHVAPRGYVPPIPPVPAVVAVGIATVPVVDERGLVHVSLPVQEDEPAPVKPPLEVRVAEILAHQEADEHEAPPPARTDEGATEDWSPVEEMAAVARPADRPAPTLARTEPDARELEILAAFDRLAASLAEVPAYLSELARVVDASLEATRLNAEAHQRWRQQVFQVQTGEWRRDLIFQR